MKNKKLLFVGLLLVAAIFLAGCTTAPKPEAKDVPAAVEGAVEAGKEAVESAVDEAKKAIEDLKNKVLEAIGKKEPIELTIEQLAHFNGEDGMRAFVAVDGIIYDMTDSPAWKDGEHNGNLAGKDLTKEIKEDSPHGIGKLENVVEVGKIKE
ncbi:MAG: hypothetical protein GXZ04_05610 [Clostridiales bacterium]|nr:hypothetical protein [Clostridiales bacterium]